MEVVPFNKEKHLNELYSWQSIHEIPLTAEDELPKIGAIVSDDKGGVAIGFLRMIEGRRAEISELITNPEREPEARDSAINLVALTLLSTAKDLGIKYVVVYSKDKNTIIRSTKFGLKKLPQTLLAVNLDNWSVQL